jgi:2-keto-4-pentenoate hydratase/2-oxohepta-3-ene-1,7-dioic acid hydratase in catechol pathway
MLRGLVGGAHNRSRGRPPSSPSGPRAGSGTGSRDRPKSTPGSTRGALDAVLGYACLNDVSARDLHLGDGQWTPVISLDSSWPIGPVIVTADELGNPSDVEIRCPVHGVDEERQSSRTSCPYFGIAEIFSRCSQAFTLAPGDVIATGTPGGVGHLRTPPVYLADGDDVVVEIERAGRLVNRCRVEAAP